jgi:2-phosphosulfolactate phosphatase
MNVDVCCSPRLYPLYHDKEAIVVVVDVFRASTSIITAFKNGAMSVRPVATVEEAMDYKEKGWLVGAERNVKRCDFADFGNSPFDYTEEKVNGKDIVFTTTNGTKAINAAKDAAEVIVGGFVNLQAVADFCLKRDRDVVVLCSGWNDKINIEDTIFAGALVAVLTKTGHFSPTGDAAIIARDLWLFNKNNLSSCIADCEHMERMRRNNLDDSVPYCLSMSITKKVPRLTKEDEILILR